MKPFNGNSEINFLEISDKNVSIFFTYIYTLIVIATINTLYDQWR